MNVIKQISLQEMAPKDSNGDFFKELLNGQILGSDFILDQAHLINNRVRVFLQGFNRFLRKSVAMQGIHAKVRFAYVVDQED